MREYTITKCCGTPDWDTVPALAIDNFLWTEPFDIRAEARICYDDQALYIYERAWEKVVRAEETGPLGSPCEDSCLEFFFRPDPEDTRYFNIEFNPNGCMYLGFGDNIDHQIHLSRLLPHPRPIVPQITRLEDGWSLTYQIPYTFIRQFFPDFRPVSGGTIRANCYKCGDLTPNAHFLAWNSVVDGDNHTFHYPKLFGLMRFE